MFPGHSTGETSQQIAYNTITATMEAYYRVDIHSSNMDFEELPQVRLYAGNDDERASAFLFGLPAIVERSMNTVFTSTIGHAWRWHGGENFVLQAGQAGSLQLTHCERLFNGLVSFLRHTGILSGGKPPSEPEEDIHLFGLQQTFPVISEQAGLFVSHLEVGRWVRRGEGIGYLYDAFDGHIKTHIVAPVSGLVSGIRRQPLLCEGDLVARIQTQETLSEEVDTYLLSHGQ
jgi:predicted deacylase